MTDNKLSQILLAASLFLFTLSLTIWIVSDGTLSQGSQTKLVVKNEPKKKEFTEAEKKQALMDLLKKQGKLTGQTPSPPKAVRPAFRPRAERHFRQAFMKEKYALILDKYPSIREDLWNQFQKERAKNPETFLLKKLDQNYAKDLVTPAKRKEMLKQLDTKNRYKIGAFAYPGLRNLCLSIGGAYQGRKSTQGVSYFLNNCFCNNSGKALKDLPWISPKIYFLGCE